MAEETKISWCDSTFNPWVGCQKVSAGCDHCLSPDTLVLYRDWTWRRLADVKVGDELLGFPESEGVLMRRLEVSIVEKRWAVTNPAARIRTEHGEIVASYDHKFIAKNSGSWRWRAPSIFRMHTKLRHIPVVPLRVHSTEYMVGYVVGATEGDGTYRLSDEKQSYWRVAVVAKQQEFLDRLREFLFLLGVEGVEIRPFNASHPGAPMLKVETRRRNNLVLIGQMLEQVDGLVSDEFCRGWLAGMFDAEGSAGVYRRHENLRPNSLRIANTKDDLLDRITEYGTRLGFDFRRERFNRHCDTARLYGTQTDRGRFFGTVRPALQYKTDACLGLGINWTESPVVAMEHLGDTDLIDIQTSTGTFFADGFAVHNCYAEDWAERYGAVEWGPHGKRKRTAPANWRKPIQWNDHAIRDGRRRKVFCASLADVFDTQAPEGARADLWDLIRRTPDLDWLLLTKRPQNILKMLPAVWGAGWHNVWLGTTAENQDAYDQRWPVLADVPAVCRFISYEPALGPLSMHLQEVRGFGYPDWLIWGGESGPKARPMDPDWARDITHECLACGVAVFGKQWGAYHHNPLVREQGLSVRDAQQQDPPDNGKGGALLDGRLWREFPQPNKENAT